MSQTATLAFPRPVISPLPRLSDVELVRRAQAGHKQALGALLNRHRARMHAQALRLCRSGADADDAVQDACLLVLEKLGQYRGEAPFSTWLYRVTHNAALLRLRRRRAGHVPLSDCAEHLAALLDRAPSPDERCQQHRDLGAVCRAVRKLTPGLRQALILREVDGLSGPAVARRLGVSPEVVKTRIHRARAALHKALPAA